MTESRLAGLDRAIEHVGVIRKIDEVREIIKAKDEEHG